MTPYDQKKWTVIGISGLLFIAVVVFWARFSLERASRWNTESNLFSDIQNAVEASRINSSTTIPTTTNGQSETN